MPNCRSRSQLSRLVLLPIDIKDTVTDYCDAQAQTIDRPMHLASYLQKIRFPLFWQVFLAMAVLLSLTTGIIWMYLSVNLNALLQNQSDTFAQAITHQAADSAAELVMADDHLALSSMLQSLVNKTKSIQHIAIYNEVDDLLVQASTPTPSLALSISQYQVPIVFQDVTAGTVKLTLDNSAIEESLQQTRNTLGAITLAIGLLALLSAVKMAQGLTAPLSRLQSVAMKIAQGDLNPTLPSHKNDELGDLIGSFRHMVQGLRDKESIEHKFSSYLSKDIAQGILADLTVNKSPLRTVRGSVLFVDIVGFTKLCEQESPEHVAEILNHYYFLIHQAAKMYRGSVDNYIGDGAMLTFGVHKEDNKHTINGICAAQIFIRLAQMMNAQRVARKLRPIEFRLGLHCGDMLAGTIGSSERMQFTISGDTVNMAARLCESAEPGLLLVSEHVVDHPSTKSMIITGPVIPLFLKGKSAPTNCYQVTQLAPKFNRLLMQQESEMEAMQDYA